MQTKERGPGRPRKRAHQRLREVLNVRLTTPDFRLVVSAARANGDRVQDWARAAILKAAEKATARTYP